MLAELRGLERAGKAARAELLARKEGFRKFLKFQTRPGAKTATVTPCDTSGCRNSSAEVHLGEAARAGDPEPRVDLEYDPHGPPGQGRGDHPGLQANANANEINQATKMYM